jgi:protein-L-isoaspartate(D-aspartate) O-methyltransferase
MGTIDDSYKHQGMRRALVKKLREKGIKDERVLVAIGKIPRHLFLDSAFAEHAYKDKAMPIGEGQTISQPYTVAFQTELLNVQPGDKVLEVGTGSGYQCCVLLELGAKVYTIEYNQKLYEQTARFLPSIGYKAYFLQGDGSKGVPVFAPYDKIIVTAGAPTLPDALVAQLNIKGKLVIPIGDNKTQKMVLIQKITDTEVDWKEFAAFSFVPLLGAHGWKKK